MLRPPTASAAERWLACNGSLYAPAKEKKSNAAMSYGTKVHAKIHNLLNLLHDPYPDIPLDFAAIHHELGADVFYSEQALAYNCLTGSTVLLSEVREREYPEMQPGDVFGTVDLIIERYPIVVRDWKSGQSVGAAQDNAQLRFLALCVARLYGVDEVLPQVGYIGKDGSVQLDEGELLTAMDLDAIAADTKRAVTGEPLYAPSDAACRWCNSKGLCEATK